MIALPRLAIVWLVVGSMDFDNFDFGRISAYVPIKIPYESIISDF